MGRATDVCQTAPHDNSGSYDGGDPEVQVTRQVTVALHWPRHGIRTRNDTSSKGQRTGSRPLSGRQPDRSRAGTPRDGRWNSTGLDLKNNNSQAG
jgi:hypothetical protein